LEGVFKHFAANIGEKEDWGRVPLSIGQEYYSFAQPLRVAYESRATVDTSLAPLGDDPTARLRAATAVVARALCETRDRDYQRHGKNGGDDRRSYGQDTRGGKDQGLSELTNGG